LTVDTEDQLFDFISSRFCESNQFFHLLEFVRFEYLRLESIERFVNLTELHQAFYAFLNISIWQQLCLRLSHEGFSGRCSTGSRAEDKLNGVIAFLTAKYGGHVHDRGVVAVTSLTDCASCRARNAADLKSDNPFRSTWYAGDRRDQWLSYAFHTGTLVLTGYSIRSAYAGGVCFTRFKNWVVETSMDGDAWTIVDEQRDNVQLMNASVAVRFDIDEARQLKCRFVRLREARGNQKMREALSLSGFEVFGDFVEIPGSLGSVLPGF
jgi:hypothetical protein